MPLTAEQCQANIEKYQSILRLMKVGDQIVFDARFDYGEIKMKAIGGCSRTEFDAFQRAINHFARKYWMDRAGEAEGVLPEHTGEIFFMESEGLNVAWKRPVMAMSGNFISMIFGEPEDANH